MLGEEEAEQAMNQPEKNSLVDHDHRDWVTEWQPNRCPEIIWLANQTQWRAIHHPAIIPASAS